MRDREKKSTRIRNEKAPAENRRTLLYGAAALVMTALSAVIIAGSIRRFRSPEESGAQSGPLTSAPGVTDSSEETSREEIVFPTLPPVPEESETPPPMPSEAEEEPGMPEAWEDGFVLDRELTEELFGRLATVNSNNCNPDSPYRSFPGEVLRELDRLSLAFGRGEKTAEETKAAMESLSFVWPDDPYAVRHSLEGIYAGVFELPGRDAEAAFMRILLKDTAARHYLFVRAYYHPERDALRIYLINGMVW